MKKVCFFTGSRADFGLLRPLLKLFNDSKKYELQIIVLAMHLSPEFGLTYREIEEAGFKITRKIENLVAGDSSASINKSIGLAQIGIADALDDLRPDIAIILGDRSEMLAAATCCYVCNIPIAHLHGGELSEGSYDDSFRHAITKMSYWHFTSTEEYRNRVIQLGENPNRVFNVGAIGLDSILNLPLLSRNEFEASINFPLGQKNILITYHPTTLEDNTAEHQFVQILDAIDQLDNTKFIFTYANSDKDGKIINQLIDDYVRNNANKAISFQSLGQLRYLSALQYVDIVLGNSSSGLIEVPLFKKPTINIGERQLGRYRPTSVIQADHSTQSILDAIELAYSIDFQNNLNNLNLPYGDGSTANKILEIIDDSKEFNFKKGFFDLNFSEKDIN